jgi:hypothetical protein
MKTYFARHSGNLDVGDDVIADLRIRHLVAIHYPWTKFSTGDDPDSRSLYADDYDKAAKGAIVAFNEAANHGGYVFATYRSQSKALLGKIAPGTPISLLTTQWASDPSKPAVLKTLQLSSCIEIPLSQQASLLAFAPRQSTFVSWHGIQNRIKLMLEGEKPRSSLSALTPTSQEVLCAEYLRTHNVEALPRLVALLMPVGRTMRDVDIVGIATDGRPLVAQVTYANEPGKLKRFRELDDGSCHMIYFSGATERQVFGNVHIVPISDAYESYTSTDVGRAWLSAIDG